MLRLPKTEARVICEVVFRLERQTWLDWSKGFAILCVVLGHVVESAPMYAQEGWMQILHTVIYAFHMPLFFFLSGCAWGLPKKQAGRERIRHEFTGILEILILYVFWSFVMYVGKSMLPGVANVVYDKSFVYCLLFAPVDPYWYLVVLGLYRGAFLLMKNRRAQRGAILAGGLLSAVLPLIQDASDSWEYRYLWRIGYHLVFFGGGVLAVYWLPQIQALWNKGKTRLTLLCGVLSAGLFCLRPFEQQLPFLKPLMAWALIVVTICVVSLVTEVLHGRRSLFLKLGGASLYIYVLHNYFTVAFRVVYNRLGLQATGLMYTLANVSIAVITCMIAYSLAKKWSVIRLFFCPIKTVRGWMER